MALKEITDGSTHLFITGKAGTGKSTLLRYYSEHAKQRPVILAPTGIAALNVSGQTIHRFFKFRPDVDAGKIARSKIPSYQARLYRTLKEIVIDEVSMMRADLLDCMDVFLRRYGPLAEWPFGGVRLIMFGDLYQLPPVVTRADRELIYDRYGVPYFFAAHALRSERLQLIELDKIFRQTDNDFISLLNSIRVNSVTKAQFDLLNSRCRSLSTHKGEPVRIFITGTNARARSINADHLSRIAAPEYRAKATVTGEFSTGEYPTDADLVMKRGARVIMLNNDHNQQWVNGSMAIITDIAEQKGEIEMHALIEETQERVQIERHTWNSYRYTVQNAEYDVEETGSFTQFPLRLAWAITVHKSQGKTFSKVHLDLGNRAFSAGQTYVALSRCRTLQDLSLQRPVARDDIYVDQSLVDFFARMKTSTITEAPKSERKDASQIAELLRQSIARKTTVRIEYIHRDGHIGYRTVIAKRISEKVYQGASYEALEAHCTESDKRCVFNTKNILDVRVLTE